MTTSHSEFISFLRSILEIESPTFHEKAITHYLLQWVHARFERVSVTEHDDSVILAFNPHSTTPHLCFVGHTDVVPAYFPPQVEGELLYGAGASDMKSALGCFLWFIHQNADALMKKYRISMVIYAREEGTPLSQNGLNDLIRYQPSFFNTVDLAIVGEPTNNTIQVGCVGSIHAQIKVLGIQAHSARPWDGENAIYNAIPVIEALSKLTPIKHTVFGVDFYDVIQLTESQSEPGRTTIPGYWKGNVNFRYAPSHDPTTAEATLTDILTACQLKPEHIHILDHAPCGRVIDSPLFRSIVNAIGADIQAKQAWTDVAQLSQLGIPAFNFGPGLTSQAHKPNEYIQLTDINTYMQMLTRIINTTL